MHDNRPARAPDYTTPSLIMGLVNLIWILGVIWAAFGLIPVLLCGLALNHAITRLAIYRAARAIVWPRSNR